MLVHRDRMIRNSFVTRTNVRQCRLMCTIILSGGIIDMFSNICAYQCVLVHLVGTSAH